MAYVREALRLARPGATIIVDNVVREGGVLDADSDDERIQGTRALLRLRRRRSEVERYRRADRRREEVGRIPDRGRGLNANRAFGYARGVAPPMWILFGLGFIELFVVHLLLSHWWPRVAAGVGIVTAASLVWLAWTIRSFASLPVLVCDERVVMRAGRLKSLTVEAGAIAEVLTSWPPELLRNRATANLAMIAYPNVIVRLRAPIRWRGRMITAIAHRLDDPAGFVRAIRPA